MRGEGAPTRLDWPPGIRRGRIPAAIVHVAEGPAPDQHHAASWKPSQAFVGLDCPSPGSSVCTQTNPIQELADPLLNPDRRAIRTRSLKGLPKEPLVARVISPLR